MDIMKILRNEGIDTSKYYALILDKDDYPDAEIKVTLPNGNVCIQDVLKEPELGKKSKFFEKIMSDGVVFNPYLHRRFIAAQFLSMMRKDLNVDRQIKENYTYMYSVAYTLKELNKLVFCMKGEDFEERSLFFSPERIVTILIDYCSKAQEFIKETSYCYESTWHSFKTLDGVSLFITSYDEGDKKSYPYALLSCYKKAELDLQNVRRYYDTRMKYKAIYDAVHSLPIIVIQKNWINHLNLLMHSRLPEHFIPLSISLCLNAVLIT